MHCTLEPDFSAEQRLTRIVTEYSNTLMKTCYVYLKDVSQAQDILQEVFVKAWTHMDLLQKLDEKAQKAWLIRTAINLCRDVYRSRWFRHTLLCFREDQIPNEGIIPNPEENLLLLDVMRLPEKQKQMVLLYYYQELTLREAAQILGVSPTAAQRRLQKALRTLKMNFEGGENE